MLHARGVFKRFGHQTVLDGVNWHIGRGARVGLVGPNGAGKTTLLRIIAGEEAPDAGEITTPKAAVLGYLPQEVETLEGGTVLGQALAGFREVRLIEEEIERIEEALAHRPDEPELGKLTERYGVLRQRFEALGGYRLEGDARAVLGGLGFRDSVMHAPLTSLSGGWRMRAALAGHLVRRPDLLLLDEPTNHLDLESLAWLEGFLDEHEGSLVVVSHDRFFLNRVVDEIAELEAGALTVYTGDYDDFVEEKAAREEALLAAKRNQDKQIAAQEKFIERFRYKATKARQVQSRIKRLDKVERIKVRRRVRTVNFEFPQPPRSGSETIRVEELRKAYGDNVVYDGVAFAARRGDRIALIGPNGAGKTTLLKILAGTLQPDAGRRLLGHNVTLHYYAQHQLEAMSGARTVMEEIETVAPDDMRPRLRSLLGSFLFSGEDIDKKVGVLSGGEKARLALAKMLVRPASLLLLDEPTNHLDLRARDILEGALDAYTGTIVFISHDRYFIDRIATSICEVADGKLDLRPGNYEEFQERKRIEAAPAGSGPIKKDGDTSAKPAPDKGSSKAARPGEAKEPAADAKSPARPGTIIWEGSDEEVAAGPAPKSRERKRAEAEERQKRFRVSQPARERLASVEGEIARFESRIQELEAAFADPATYKDGEKARELHREHKELQERVAWLYDEWSGLEETLSKL